MKPYLELQLTVAYINNLYKKVEELYKRVNITSSHYQIIDSNNKVLDTVVPKLIALEVTDLKDITTASKLLLPIIDLLMQHNTVLFIRQSFKLIKDSKTGKFYITAKLGTTNIHADIVARSLQLNRVE